MQLVKKIPIHAVTALEDFGVLIGLGFPASIRGDSVGLKDRFKEPTRISLIAATILAVFQFLNTFGFMDDVVSQFGLYNGNDGHEKFLIIPAGFSLEFWGILKVDWRDYIVAAFLLYTLIGLWLHRPVEPGVYVAKKKKKKLITLKSPGWFRISVITLIIAITYTLNKSGKIASIASDALAKEFVGRIAFVDGSISFTEEPIVWVFRDFAELSILYILFIFGMRRSINIDRSRLDELADTRTQMQKIWKSSYDAEKMQRTDVLDGASRINSAFTDLVNMLGAAASLNLAAASLDEGNVKNAFNKWKNLTHSKGVQSDDWKNLSASLDDIGKFKSEEDEEE